MKKTRRSQRRQKIHDLIPAILGGADPSSLRTRSLKDFRVEDSIKPLLFHLLHEGKLTNSLSEGDLDALSQKARLEALIEEGLVDELKKVLQLLNKQKIPSLLIKGMPLSYNLYPKPGLRPKTDIDLWIPEGKRKYIPSLMKDLGFKLVSAHFGDLIRSQASYTKMNSFGIPITLDIHWKLINTQVLKDLISFKEAWIASISVSNLSRHARTLSWEHAFVLACVHRKAHHHDEDNLLWLYDIHLLTQKLGKTGLTQALRFAEKKGVLHLCLVGLDDVNRTFSSDPQLEPVIHRFKNRAMSLGEKSEIYLTQTHSFLKDIWADMEALPNMKSKAEFLFQHAVPSREYMRTKYPSSSRLALPFLYLLRAVSGMKRAFRK